MRLFLIPLAACALALPGGRYAPDARAGSAQRMELEELVQGSDLVLAGRVLSAEARRDLSGHPETRLVLAVEHAFLGDVGPEARVTLPGGVLPDGSGMFLAGMPPIRVGEELLLLLSAESSRGWRLPIGLEQGKFQLVRDEAGTRWALRGARRDPAPAVSGRLRPEAGTFVIEYAELRARIEAELARRPASGEGR